MINNFKDKKVLVFGLGLNQGGVGSAKFFASQGARVRVTDLRNTEILKASIDELKNFPDIEYSLEGHRNEDINWADVIIKNPSVKPGNEFIEYAKKIGKKIVTDIEIFLKSVDPQQIIGVTGSKGKSTTASLIYEAFKKELTDRRIVFSGNIGVSVLDSLELIDKKTLVLLEISSFQLEAFAKRKISPKWAIITNIYPDHLNYYKIMEEYILAKRIIGLYQTKNDCLFINKEDPKLNNPKFLKDLKGKLTFFSPSDLPEYFKPNLKGHHNLSNIAATLALGQAFGLKNNKMLEVFAQFKGIAFRMELIRTWNGFKIYNDTAATNPDATIQAIQALGNSDEDKDQNIILICGGMNKNMDYKKLAQTIDWYAKAIYFIEGDIVDDLICNISDKSEIEGRFSNFEDLLKKLKEDIEARPFWFKKGDIILFSPAGTSFNLFQNEWDRGRKFNEAVKKIFGEDK